MFTFQGRNFNKIYLTVADSLENNGLITHPRGKKTVELTQAMIKIDNPKERVCSSRPGFNIAFSIAEILWILQGSANAEMICHYLDNFKQFLDPEYPENFHGAYGARIFNYGYDERKEFDFEPYVNQFEECAKKLKKDPDTRQAVISIWNPWKDNLQDSRDYACNNLSYLKIRNGKLNWTQVLRSNDLYWGTPQNIFQFTFLQEIMAGLAGVEVGHYVQMSDSLHVYQDSYYDKEKMKPNTFDLYDYYLELDDYRLYSIDQLNYTVKILSEIEESSRKGAFEFLDKPDNIFMTLQHPWRNFAAVIVAFNLLKFDKTRQAIDFAKEYVHGVYYPLLMKQFLVKIKKNETELIDYGEMVEYLYSSVALRLHGDNRILQFIDKDFAR